MSTHVLSLLVEDKPGLLTRVAGLFARRGFNIESLAVGHSEIEGLSRITVVVDVDELPLEQVTKQLNKLINVIKIVELDPTQSVQREHLLIKVRGRQRDPFAGARGRQPVPRPRRRRRHRCPRDRGHRRLRQDRGASCACSSPTASRRSPSRACSPSAAAPRSITERVFKN